MNSGRILLSLLVGSLVVTQVQADAKSKAVQETVEYIVQRFGRQAAREGEEVLARKLESYAATHGEEFLQAARKVGPRSFTLVEEAGAHSKQAISAMARHGESGAVWIASRPKALQLVAEHGELAEAALLKHPGVAEPLIEALGKPSIKALQAVDGQNARRLAIMTESGELASIGRTEEVLGVIEKFGTPAMAFIWENKGSLTVATTLTAFLAKPETFIKPLAEVPSVVAKEASGEIAKSTNWTFVFCTGLLIVGAIVAFRFRPRSS